MLKLEHWEASPSEVKLFDGQIHVWKADLDCADGLLQSFYASLAPEETARAERFFFSGDRNRFVSSRGILRRLLGKYIGCEPSVIQFGYTAHGKPFLKAGRHGSTISFNLSHSQGLALFAFAHEPDLGVDVELVRSDFGGEDIAARFFAPDEVQELRALPEALRAEGFFLCWTRKEAYIKARGQGLSIPLDSFRVSLTPGEPERLYGADVHGWSLRTLRPKNQYVGALAASGHDWRLKCWSWAPAKS